MSTHPNITLITPEPLEKDLAKRWRDTVVEYLPNGVQGSTNIISKGHSKQSEFYITKFGKQGGYVVPLTRDLTEDEAGLIAVAWDKVCPAGDFIVDFSQTQQSKILKATMQEDILNEISEQVAKRLHADDIKVKVEEGWNYGPRKDRILRLDPTLLPWEQLGNKIKKFETSRVRKMLAILESINFDIVRRNFQ